MNQINLPHKLRILNSNKEVAEELIAFIRELGFSKVVLITTKTPNYLITNDLEVALFDHLQKLKTFQVINASISYVNQLPITDFDVVVGVGGGRVIDTAKYAAYVNNIPCISIPTAISNDGICSPVAVLREKQNKYKSLGAAIPIGLFVPLHIVKDSDEESIISGVGDLLSNLSAVEDWELAGQEAGEYVDDYAVMVSKHAANEIFLLAKNYILLRKSRDEFLRENLREIIESLALSGIAMEIAGTSRPASGAEHLISHAIDELYGGLKPHGIQVAFGMYLVSFIRRELGFISNEEFEEIRAVLRYLDVPVTLGKIGLTKEQLIQVLLHAPKTRPDRVTVLSKLKMDEKYINTILDQLFTHTPALPVFS